MRGWEVPSVVSGLQRWHARGLQLGTPLGAAAARRRVGCSDGVLEGSSDGALDGAGWEPCSAPLRAPATERWTARG